MRSEIKDIIIKHPEAGEISKRIRIDYDENGNEITREFICITPDSFWTKLLKAVGIK